MQNDIKFFLFFLSLLFSLFFRTLMTAYDIHIVNRADVWCDTPGSCSE